MAYLALSKGGSRVHYPRVATIQGWIWGPLSKGGHYPRVATIELLSKALFGSTVQEATCRFSSPEEPKPTTKDLGEGVVDLKFFRALEGEVKSGGGGSQKLWRGWAKVDLRVLWVPGGGS